LLIALALVLVGAGYYLVTQVVTVRRIRGQWSRLSRVSLVSLLPQATPTFTPLPTQTVEWRPTPTRIPTATRVPSPLPTASPTVTQTITPTTQPTAAQATATPGILRPTATAAFPYPVVELLAPGNGTDFAGDSLALTWKPVGDLGTEEWYGVSLRYWVSGLIQYDGAWVKETSWPVRPELRHKPDAVKPGFEWDVRVMKRVVAAGGGSQEVALSPPSETRTFLWP